MNNPAPWVPGWSLELLLCVLSGVALWRGVPLLAAVYVTGAMIIAVIRGIEKDRRASNDATTSPTPRSKV